MGKVRPKLLFNFYSFDTVENFSLQRISNNLHPSSFPEQPPFHLVDLILKQRYTPWHPGNLVYDVIGNTIQSECKKYMYQKWTFNQAFVSKDTIAKKDIST